MTTKKDLDAFAQLILKKVEDGDVEGATKLDRIFDKVQGDVQQEED